MTKIVTLDAGHGGTDPGAVGNGLQEKDLTLSITKRVESYLRDHYEVHLRLTRSKDQNVSLGMRTRNANAWGSDCLVSIHINSAGDPRANGFESFVYTTDGPSSKSVALQNQLHARLAELFKQKGRRDRGKKKANFHMVREFRGAAVLLELGFIVNREDARLLKDPDFLSQAAAAIAEGIADHLDLPKKKAEPKPETVYRVIVDGEQVGAYAEGPNVVRQVEKAMAAGKKRVELELV